MMLVEQEPAGHAAVLGHSLKGKYTIIKKGLSLWAFRRAVKARIGIKLLILLSLYSRFPFLYSIYASFAYGHANGQRSSQIRYAASPFWSATHTTAAEEMIVVPERERKEKT